MTVGFGRCLGAAAATVVAVGVWAGPGAPPAAAYVCSFGIDSPTSGDPSGSASVSFGGPFAVKGQTDRTIEISFTGAPAALPPKVTRSGAAVGPADRYDVAVGGLSRNGRYSAQVLFRQTDKGLVNCAGALDPAQRDATERTASVTFSVSVKARPPTSVQARFDAGPPRTAVVSWEESPDPDTAGYELSRTVGSGPVEPLTDVPRDTRSWTDQALPDAATTITYTVRSARNGPLPGTTSERSDAVMARLDVPAPPPTTTTLPAAGTGGTLATGSPGGTTGGTTPGAGSTSPGTTVAPGSSPAGQRNTGTGAKPFVLGQAVPGTSAPGGAAPVLRFPNGLIGPSGAPVSDDGGFQPTLPYAAPAEQLSLPLDDRDDQALGGSTVEGGRGRGDRRTPQLAYVAGALLSAVVAAHILWLRGQVLRPSAVIDDALPVDPAPSPDLAVPPPSAGPPAARPPVRATASRPIMIGRPDAGAP